MFIEITRVYRNGAFEHKMLLNVHPILKVEPCDPKEYIGNVRIVLDRKQENNEYMVIYVAELYSQVAYRIKALFTSGLTTPRKNAKQKV